MDVQITSAGLWSPREPQYDANNVIDKETKVNSLKVADENIDESTFLDGQFWTNKVSSSGKSEKSTSKFGKSDNELLESQPEISTTNDNLEDTYRKLKKDESRSWFPISAKESLKAAIFRIIRKWHLRFSFLWKHSTRILGSLWVSGTLYIASMPASFVFIEFLITCFI